MKKWLVRTGWMAAGVAALYAAAALAGSALGGPLDPPGPPGPTMRTLDTIPPSWFRLLASNDGGGDGCSSSRFGCVMGGQAVIDLETGLVWQREAGNGAPLWETGVNLCRDLVIQNRKGWRLPTASELSSLIDMSGAVLKLPAGHPFTGLQTVDADDPHWTFTPDASAAGFVTVVFFGTGGTQTWPKTGSPAQFLERVWCVRAGENS